MLNKGQIGSFLRKLDPKPTALQPSFVPKEDIRCILFDVYGTLFISETGDIGLLKTDATKQEQLNRLLNDFNLKTTPENLNESLANEINRMHTQKRGEGIDYPEVNIVEVWCSILNRLNKLTWIQLEEFAIKFELIVNPVYSMPGLRDCLHWCKKNQKVMGIISNAQFYTPMLFNWFLDADPQQLGFSDKLLFYSYQQNLAKPSTLLFEKAARELKNQGIKSNQVAYLGNDMLKDILPAKRVGFQTALFAGDSRSLRLRKEVPDCLELEPDMIITHLNQLKNW